MSNINVRDEIRQLAEANFGIRHYLHKNPQTAREEFIAKDTIQTALDEAGVEYVTMCETATVATIKGTGESSSRTIAIRVDIDALNIQEQTGLEYASNTSGKMHACGHDGHTTIGITLAQYLAQNTDSFKGTVKLIFQHAEEAAGGAEELIDAGLFKDHPADEIYMIHNWPYMQAGQAAVHFGPVMAYNTNFTITAEGQTGHVGTTEMQKNAFHSVSRLVTASLEKFGGQESAWFLKNRLKLQFSLPAKLDDTGPNTVDTLAAVQGSLRCYSERTARRVQNFINKQCQSLSDDDLRLTACFPHQTYVTINSRTGAKTAAAAAREVFGSDNVFTNVSPAMTADDGGALLREVGEGAYFWIGQGTGDPKSPHDRPLHDNGYDFNNRIIAPTAEIFVRIVENRLSL